LEVLRRARPGGGPCDPMMWRRRVHGGSSMRTRPSIAAVAHEAGVSTATAGRALGNYGRLSSATSERVLRVARALGYQPNRIAKSLISGTSNTVGVIVPDISNQFFAKSVRGISNTVRAAGYEVMLSNSDGDLEREDRAINIFEEKRIDGVIIAVS